MFGPILILELSLREDGPEFSPYETESFPDWQEDFLDWGLELECRWSSDFWRVILQREGLLDLVVGLASKDLCLVIIADFLVGKRKFPMLFWP